MTMQDQQHNTATESNQDCCNKTCREQYASEHINELIAIKERELNNLIILRDMLPVSPSHQQHRAIRQLIK